ncbi:MAG: sulfatase [Candidatus Latescibacteria bacterium]|nr:sulfatase [Candidatus Latescibacterota bacterium]
MSNPNLIYLFADQLRYFSCGFAGDPWAQTPNMDRLATQSLSCINTTACTPVCAAYRASLFTGKFQSSHGMVINELRLSPNHDCFGHALTRANYNTAYIGKWHLWANQLGHHNQIGNAFTPPGPYRLGFDGYWAGYNFSHHSHGAVYFEDTCDPIPYEGYEADTQTDMAINFLQNTNPKENPFALFLSWGPPHDPWGSDNLPEGYWERFHDCDIQPRPNFSTQQDPYADNWATMPDDYRNNLQDYMRGYYAQVANIDWNLGRIMDIVDQLGIADNTYFVFTSDHGEMWGSQGRRAKNIFYDEACRVPFLIRHPNLAQNSTNDVCLNTTDLMPTLLSFLNLPVPPAAEGVDLSRVLTGESAIPDHAALMQGMGTTAAWKDGHEWRALRDQQHTYATYRVDGKELLFDNLNDPYQMKNLADDPSRSPLLKHYRDQLQTRLKEQNDTLEPCTWYEDQWTQDRNIMRGAKGGSHDLDQLADIIQKHFPDDVWQQQAK